MGYDIVALDAAEGTGLGATELGPAEQAELAAFAVSEDLGTLTRFPEYWGAELRLTAPELPALLREVRQLEGTEGLSRELTASLRRIRELCEVAQSQDGVIYVVPD
ncbi:MAG: hypothetical protein KDB16_03060 [Acidimicrobiales bacterium]|nr:hypothetical protein [Planctomycetota bacterium]MCB0989932.1 hypothetical protein [Acidimicrobiales bacterium]